MYVDIYHHTIDIFVVVTTFSLGLRFGFFFVSSVRSNRTNGSVWFGSAVRRTTYVRTISTAYVRSYTYVELGISEISALSAEFLRNEKHSFNHELPRCLAAATSTLLLASAIVNEVAAFCFLCRITHHPSPYLFLYLPLLWIPEAREARITEHLIRESWDEKEPKPQP